MTDTSLTEHVSAPADAGTHLATSDAGSDLPAFPGVPGDGSEHTATPEDLTGLGGMALPRPRSGASPEEASGAGHVAYAVHAGRLTGAQSQGGVPLPTHDLDADTLALLQAALRLTSSLKVRDALRRLAESACSLTGASWGTIAVLNQTDETTAIHAGTPTTSPDALASRAARAMSPQDQLPLASREVVVDNDTTGTSSAFVGAIEGEDAGSLLTVLLELHGQVYGRLYLCDKPGGFSSADVTTVLTLAGAAAVAVENARLYREARDREQWMAVSQELTTLLLSGAEEDDALTLIAKRVRQVAHADTSVLVMPSIGDTWACEIADGEHADSLVGTFFPPDGRARSSLARRTGLIVPSLAQEEVLRVPALARFGPALYAPMVHHDEGVGVMLLLREVGAPPFTAQDLEIAELVAGQATMAFELADAQHAEEMATLLDERARIGRDLHDLAIQQLFATGMQISAAREKVLAAGRAAGTGDAAQGAADGAQDAGAGEREAIARALEDSLAAVDDSVRQIRSIVRSLRDRDEDVSVVERLRREASLARTSLGYAPSLLLSVDGQALAHVDRSTEDSLIDAVDKGVDEDVADDMVAVVREGLSNVARHAHASSVTVDVKVEGVCVDRPGRPCPPCAERRSPGTGPASGDAEPYEGRPVVEIVVRDDGVGVDPAVTRRSGTANMAERARRHGGSFVIGPRARSDGERRGTCFTWRVPLDGQAPAGPRTPRHQA